MKTYTRALACMAALVSTAVEAQQPGRILTDAEIRSPVKEGPHFQIDCAANPSTSTPEISAKTAIIWSPRNFHTTNSKFKLKFYEADIEFEGDLMPLRIYRAGKPGSPILLNSFPFDRLTQRIKDDDLPTIFARDGKIFEIQSTSPLPRKMDGAKSMNISFGKPFSLLIESFQSDGKRKLAWAGRCSFRDPKAKQ